MNVRYFITIWKYPDGTAKLTYHKNFEPYKCQILSQVQFFSQGGFIWVVMPDGSCHQLGRTCNLLWGIDLFDLVEIIPA